MVAPFKADIDKTSCNQYKDRGVFLVINRSLFKVTLLR
jgi:hypothetical protein